MVYDDHLDKKAGHWFFRDFKKPAESFLGNVCVLVK